MAEPLTPKEDGGREEKQTPRFRGLYEHVHISVRTLDIIIVCCIAVIVIVMAVDLSSHHGLTVSFDSRGGTDVQTQQIEYGEPLAAPEPPTREGYRFTGWYQDTACDLPWSIEADKVQKDMTLYAGWEKK